MPPPMRHCIERRKSLEPRNIHAKRELAVTDLNRMLPVKRGQDKVMACYQGVAVDKSILAAGANGETGERKKQDCRLE